MTILQRVSAIVGTGVLVASALTPAAFAQTIEANGAGSVNTVTVTNLSSDSVTQTNNQTVVTTVNSTANSGGNSSSFNTGGSSTITTGGAASNVGVTVGGNTNEATSAPCGCLGLSLLSDPAIVGNGAGSHNTVTTVSSTSNKVKQTNNSLVLTTVTSKAKTGKNSSSFNTGGATGIGTGPATSGVGVTVFGSTNMVNPGLVL